MRKTYAALPLLSLILLFANCTKSNREDRPPKSTWGYTPIYDSTHTATVISATSPQPIDSAGKIYVKGNTFFQVDVGKGIHVIDITDPAHPQKKAFINILGCTDMSIQGSTLYTNNLNDLVIVDIANTDSVVVKDRIVSAFNTFNPNRPPDNGYYWFECINPEKGAVIGWEIKILESPKCKLY